MQPSTYLEFESNAQQRVQKRRINTIGVIVARRAANYCTNYEVFGASQKITTDRSFLSFFCLGMVRYLAYILCYNTNRQ